MNDFMQIAIKEAQKGIDKRHGGPFGACVVKNGKIIGIGHNQVLKQNDCTCHAEIIAIRRACKNLQTYDLSDCEIYTTAEPCMMCMGAILWSNIQIVYYGCTHNDSDKIGFRDETFQNLSPSHIKNFKHCINRQECLAVFKKYSSQIGHKKY